MIEDIILPIEAAFFPIVETGSIRASINRFPAKFALRKRNIIPSLVCSLCGMDESEDHILLNYYLADNLWSAFATWCKLPSFSVSYIKDLLKLSDLCPYNRLLRSLEPFFSPHCSVHGKGIKC